MDIRGVRGRHRGWRGLFPRGIVWNRKAARLVSLGLITPLVAVQIVRDKESVERLAWSMLGFGVVMSLAAIAGGGDPRFYGKLAAFGFDTIALGRVAGYRPRSQGSAHCAACVMPCTRRRSWPSAGLRFSAQGVEVLCSALLPVSRCCSWCVCSAAALGGSWWWLWSRCCYSSSLLDRACCQSHLWKR